MAADGKLQNLELLVRQLVPTKASPSVQEAAATVCEAMEARTLVQLEDDHAGEETADDFDEAIAKGKLIEGHVTKWLVEKSLGFLSVQGRTVFAHASSVRKRSVLVQNLQSSKGTPQW